VVTLEKAIVEYLRLTHPPLIKSKPHLPLIFSSAAISLASRMWVDGTAPSPWPGVYYIALIGEPGTMKSEFVNSYLKLIDPNVIKEIARGSPEAVVIDLADKRHGYLWYDELGDVAKRLNGYLGPLIPFFNAAYYLRNVSQARTKKENSIFIPAGDYFIHAYFCGTPEDWEAIKEFAAGGFVRRTLVIPVEGEPPYFKRDHDDPNIRNYISMLRSRIKRILRVLASFDVEVKLPNYPKLGEELKSTVTSRNKREDRENKIMIHEYTQKIIAARILGNLITFDVADDVSGIGVMELLNIIERNAVLMGVKVLVEHADRERAIIKIIVPEEVNNKEAPLEKFLPPHYEYLTFRQLVETIKVGVEAPSGDIAKNIKKIDNWLAGGGPVVVKRRTFIRKILSLRTAGEYKPVMELLLDGGYIKEVDHIDKGRNVRYVILDPKAKICANCTHFRSEECPLLKGVYDLKKRMLASPPWKPACEKFKLEWEPEPEEVDKG